jgi:non-specific protein-tyrosine kinase
VIVSAHVARRQLTLVLKWLPILVAASLLFAIGGAWVARLSPPSYEATAKLVVQPGATPSVNDVLLAQQLASDYATVAGSRDFAQSIVDGLGIQESADDLLKQLTTTVDPGSAVLIVKATDRDPNEAAAIANAFANALREKIDSQISGGEPSVVDQSLASISTEIEANQTVIDGLLAEPSLTPDQQSQLSTLLDRQLSLQSTYAAMRPYSSAAAVGHLQVLETAIPPTKPTGFSPLFLAVLSGLAAFLLLAGILFAFLYLDDTIGSAVDVETISGATLLATLQDRRRERKRKGMDRLVTVSDPNSDAADAYRTLAAMINLKASEHGIRVLQVTSTPTSTGALVTAANLAAVFAQSGRRVVLIDADLRRPQLHLILSQSSAPGLSELLVQPKMPLDKVVRATSQANLRIVTAGSDRPDGLALLVSDRMRAVLERVLSVADLVVIASPPIPDAFDAIPVGTVADGTLLVVPRKESHRHDVRDATQTLTDARANLLGIALFRSPRF